MLLTKLASSFRLNPPLSSWSDTITDDLDIAKPTVVLCHHGVRWARSPLKKLTACRFRWSRAVYTQP
jgi:hypothetical protein